MPTVFTLAVDSVIELRQLERGEAAMLFALTEKNCTYLRRWLPWLDDTYSVDDSRAFIESGHERYANRESMELGVWHRSSLVGMVAFNQFAWGSRGGELGYWLDAEAQGSGLMTRACRALMAHGFSELDLHRVEIRCAVNNLKSRAIPERLGFRHEGRLREVEWLYDHFVDQIVYGLLAREKLQ